jgi:hypothetical protein
MKRILFALIVGCTVFVLNSSSLWAQATAQISGTAKDRTGAVLPGVEITATQTETAATRSAVTNETGSYVLSNLPIGPYRLEASLPGFRTFAQTGIVLEVDASPVINPALDVGQVTEQVEVQANAALVETRSVGVGQVMENARILDLPLNGRQVVELLALSGAATPSITVNGSNRDPFARGNVSIAGGLSTGLLYTLDGANHNNQYSGSYLSMPFPDAMQEFKVETSATSAQNGVKSSGMVSLVTKSGTNQFHGDLFEFVRNGVFNARNAFSPKRDTIKRNQFGGTIGGPIMNNKLFFFGGYQGTIIRQDPPESVAFVPTAAMLAGDWTTFTSPACNGGRQMTLRAPFVNNRIDPALYYSKAAVNFSKLLPSPTDPCGRMIYSSTSTVNNPMVIGRLDLQKSDKHSIFGRYLIESDYSPPPYDLNHNLLSTGNGIANGTGGTGDDGRAQAFTVGDTYLLSPGVVNSFRFSANRFHGGKTVPDFKDCHCGFADIGIQGYTATPHDPRIQVTGAFGASPQGGPTHVATFAVSDDISIVHKNHQIALGVNAASSWINSYSASVFMNFTFSGSTTGLALADFLTGNASNFQNGNNIEQHNRFKSIGLYANDTWKLNQKVTVNYGLRWEPYLPQVNNDRTSSHFDEDAWRKGIKTNRFINAPPGFFFDTDPGFPGLSGINNQWLNFSPRLGIAWDPKGDGRTSIRLSGGTFYDYPAGIYRRDTTTLPPWNPRVGLNTVNFDKPWSGYPGGDPFPIPGGKDLPRDISWLQFSGVTATDYDSPNMRVGQWNLSVQRQIGSDWLVSASYLGNATRHVWTTRPINSPVFLGLGPCTLNGVQYPTCSTTGNINQRRRLYLENPVTGLYYGVVNKIDTGGTASYNGLLLSVQRRVSRGITLSGNYTWSHCITDIWQEAAESPNLDDGWGDPNNRRFDRGNCAPRRDGGTSATDRRQVFTFSSVASTPQFSGGLLRAAVSGWRLSPLIKILSGDFLSVTTSQDRALNGMANQRVNQVLGNPYGNKTVSSYLNPAAFTLPALGTLGNLGKSNIAGPGTWQFDMALSRTFQIRESKTVEFRAEAFNVTNSMRMNDPVTNFSSGAFGQVTSSLEPRIMQFALKYLF